MDSGDTTSELRGLSALTDPDPLDLLATDHKRCVAHFVQKLRTDEYDVGHFLEEMRDARSVLLRRADATAEQVAGITQLDRLIVECLSKTSLIHERAIEGMSSAFCELTPDGVITYANRAMTALVPGCEGTRLAEHFLHHSDLFEGALGSGGHGDVRELELRTAGDIAGGSGRPVRVEIGRVEGSDARFAILDDLSGARQAEQLVYSRADFGVLSLARDLTIIYANPAAERLLGLQLREIKGRSAIEFVSPDYRQAVISQNRKRPQGESSTYTIEISKPDGSSPTSVRVIAVPRYDSLNHYVGLTVALHSLEDESVYRAIMELALCGRSAEEIWTGMLDAMRAIFDFDIATLTFYTEDCAYARAELSWPKPLMREYYRWFFIPEPSRGLIGTPKWHPDLETYVRQRPNAEELLQQPTLQALLKNGIGPFVSLPVKHGNGFHVVFSLMSKTEGAFDDQTIDRLREVGVDAALGAILQRFDTLRSEFKLEMVEAMAGAGDMRQLATGILDRLRIAHKWDHASLFKINALGQRFEMLAQSYASEEMRLPDECTQPLDQGLLGLAYRRAIEHGPDIKARVTDYSALRPRTEEGQHHLRGCSATRSEMCGAISLEGRPVWMLNFEDGRDNAFMDVDFGFLAEAIAYLEENVKRAFNEYTLIQILDAMQDGVVICNVEGKIIRLNRKAQGMFAAAGLQEIGPGAMLGDHLDELAAQSITEPPSRTPIEAVLGNGERRVLLTTATLDDSYDHRVILLTDVQEDQWSYGTQVMMKAVQEVVEATRRPRSIATTLLGEIRDRAAGGIKGAGDIGEMASRAMRQLNELNIGYEKILRSNAIARFDEGLDVGTVLKEIVGRLPSERQRCVLLDLPDELPRARLAASALANILSGMLARMLEMQCDGNVLTIQARASTRWAMVSMRGRTKTAAEGLGAEPNAGDEHVRSIHRIVREHRGNLRQRVLPDGDEELSLALPVQQAQVEATS